MLEDNSFLHSCVFGKGKIGKWFLLFKIFREHDSYA